MKKWNKSDTKFILKSLAISGVAILIWFLFVKYQINENYLTISLNEKEAKQKALQYFSSRAWDISGHTYSVAYRGNVNQSGDGPYTTEIVANKDRDIIKNIDHLSGARRWVMRWYNPPNEEEFQIGYTKDGELTYFYHILPDTLAGDSLPQDIAINIAKSAVDMTSHANRKTVKREDVKLASKPFYKF